MKRSGIFWFFTVVCVAVTVLAQSPLPGEPPSGQSLPKEFIPKHPSREAPPPVEPLPGGAITGITDLQQAPELQVTALPVSVMTQLVFRTQFVRLERQNAVRDVPAYKPWIFPGLGHIAIGEKGRGTVLAVIFSATAFVLSCSTLSNTNAVTIVHLCLFVMSFF